MKLSSIGKMNNEIEVTVSLEDTEDLATGHALDLSNTVRVTKNNTDL